MQGVYDEDRAKIKRCSGLVKGVNPGGFGDKGIKMAVKWKC
jgi:hypothetical protein